MLPALNPEPDIPLSIYLHLPWCIRKCPYCDFNSHEIGVNMINDEGYVNALLRDLDFELPGIRGRRINSIFLGGGTPSLFSTDAVDKLLSGIRARLDIPAEAEITLEANPGTAEGSKFREFSKAGINRLSLGIQSFDDDKLKSLGRIHNSQGSKDAITMAQAGGFRGINLDLMFGLPGQTVRDALDDLETAISFQPEHISWYQLTIEPNTVFYSDPPDLPDHDTLWEMQETGGRVLKNNGYQQYEVSAFSRENCQCAHNINYWQFGDYLGLGAGAHSKLTDHTAGRITRYARHRLPARYMELAGRKNVITESRLLTRTELPIEFMMNALRLIDGVPTGLMTERTGISIDEIGDLLRQAEAKGLIARDMNQIKPTNRGTRYLNDLLQLFLP